MSNIERPPSFSFHVKDDQQDAHTVPASVLVQILENAQRAFELIGLQVEGREIRLRARVAAATSKRFQLLCQLPKPGSYAMPVTVGGAGDLFPPDLANRAFDIFRDVMESVSARSSARLANLLPNERIRRRVLEAVKGMAPRADSQWRIGLARRPRRLIRHLRRTDNSICGGNARSR